MSEAELVQRIVAIVRANPDLAPRGDLDAAGLHSRFREDLGLDSVALMAIAFELIELAPALDESAIARWKTVGDCVATVRAALEH